MADDAGRLQLLHGKPIYRRLFDFWLRIFAVPSASRGVWHRHGVPVRTNWSELSRRSGNIQGGLLAYESFSAFMLEAAFFGILIFGRKRVPPLVYFLATIAISLGTDLSSFWILANNSWMQHPTASSWPKTPSCRRTGSRSSPLCDDRPLGPHDPRRLRVTTSFCVAATGAWYALQKRNATEARIMLRFGLGLAAVLVPMQLVMGHLVGGYVVADQPSKITALEGRWHAQQPAGEILIAWPDPAHERNLFEIALPAPIGSIIDSMSLTAREPASSTSAGEQAEPLHHLLHVPDHGRSRRADAGPAWVELSRVAKEAPGDALVPVAGLHEFSHRLRGDAHGVVHGRDRAANPGSSTGTSRDGRCAHAGADHGTVTFTLLLFGSIYAIIFIAGTFYIYRTLSRGPEALDKAPENTTPTPSVRCPSRAAAARAFVQDRARRPATHAAE